MVFSATLNNVEIHLFKPPPVTGRILQNVQLPIASLSWSRSVIFLPANQATPLRKFFQENLFLDFLSCSKGRPLLCVPYFATVHGTLAAGA
ncbi:hypothetical protein CYLTODRAFT_201084 [Cylindrobasidium torrendii FP15055 ss-10]|uniref:Uncharacterized protein n=1 Tax=Cylindrobasidium torrendii FP15055 ss-10 TaxID=1314674 RepID=A0A0D7BKR9_9AGAR|nr:hypothetical protein CYLTODRAFT_201084 [Cylindrobasidium torrendii FP15055 ss-10]